METGASVGLYPFYSHKSMLVYKRRLQGAAVLCTSPTGIALQWIGVIRGPKICSDIARDTRKEKAQLDVCKQKGTIDDAKEVSR